MGGARKASLTVYCSPLCAYGHQVRIVLNEKAIDADIAFVDPARPPEDLIDLNPYATTPTLVDRDLVLYDPWVIMEYLDERFPHPPLHPTDPVARARNRMLVRRIERDWYSLLDRIESVGPREAEESRLRLREGLIAARTLFASKPFFLSDEYTLVDCTLAPLLWRLGAIGIALPKACVSIRRYADRLFARDAFQGSLTERERILPLFAMDAVIG